MPLTIAASTVGGVRRLTPVPRLSGITLGMWWRNRRAALDSDGRSELHYAARDGDAAAARKLIRQGCDPRLADRGGWTPLHFAAQAQSAPVIQILLEAGAQVDPRDAHGNTPLWRATSASRGEGDAIRMLRAAGADPYAKNNSGVSPVADARMVANFDIAQHFADLPKDP